MSTSGRKGNWNEIAGTAKHQFPKPIDKDLKKVKEKELSGHPQKKSGKTKNELHKPITKT